MDKEEEDLEKLLNRQFKYALYYELNREKIINRVKKYNANHKLDKIKYAKNWYENKKKQKLFKN